MKCPLKLTNPDVIRSWDSVKKSYECDPECAWLLERGCVSNQDWVCAIAVIASSGTEPMGFFPANVIERGA